MKFFIHFAIAVFAGSSWAATTDNVSYDFEGLVMLSDCSGALVIFENMPQSAKALVMTNGHCIFTPDGNFLAPGEVWVNRKATLDMQIFDSQRNIFQIRTAQLLYATMTDTDVAFYELTQSYAEIKNSTKVRPFLLDSHHPTLGQAIDIISGETFNGYSCQIDAFVFNLKEDVWTFKDSIRYDGCNTISGTSGSPLIARNERRIVGINNTSNKKGESCTLDNPCEVNENGQISAQQGVSYGQQTYQVYSCLTPAFGFDLDKPNCKLPK